LSMMEPTPASMECFNFGGNSTALD
jgi:hypothetical protein